MRIINTIFFLLLSYFTIAQKLPYPIIFIHGLNSESSTWNSFTNYINTYGLTYGGRMDFCLNNDANSSTSLFSNDYKDFTAISNSLTNADYYHINFNVDRWGNTISGTMTTVYSNQQAIYKQGRAVRDAIKYVLSITGKDKVILVGHSMGGLASREYLSNSNIWQNDGKHHVAKLFTTGTPHGGSNSTSFGISGLFGIDESQESIRDLRYSYTYSGNSGVYLFGGTENLNYMWDRLLFDFYNADVNCNGIINENIIGLNSKVSPNDLYYSCAIGTGAILGGDGVVSTPRSNMTNYLFFQVPLAFSADTFMVYDNSAQFHTDLPNKTEINLKGLDEPSDPNLAYYIDTNKTYLGMATAQSGSTNGFHYDYDYYQFDMKPKNSLRVSMTATGFGYAFAIFQGSTSIHIVNPNKTIIDTLLEVSNPVSHYFSVRSQALRGYAPKYTYKLSLIPFLEIVNQPISQTLCGTDFATISVSVTGKGPFSYKWNTGSTASFITTSVAGNYFVTISGVSDVKVSNIATLTKVNCIPNIVLQPQSQTICGNNLANVSLSATGYNSNAFTYKWNNGIQSRSFTTSTPGTYFVTIVGANAYKIISNTGTITSLNCYPKIVQQPINQTVCGNSLATISVSATGIGSLQYVWNLGNTTNAISTLVPGNYVVTVIGYQNYKTVSNIGTLTTITCNTIASSVIEHSKEHINIYPNPVNNLLYISIPDPKPNFTIELIDEIGITLYTNIHSENMVTIDMNNYSRGLYLVKISSINGNHFLYKVLKQ
ncbi:MAG: alpha/beta fold hydrolase [Bacteroidota bacterium]|nr:alpha/beta fold hydrolase [Bacteroidota bacterium]